MNVSGLQGASLNHGTLNPDGSYTLDASDLQGLAVTPGAEFTGTLTLTVTATDSEPSSGTTATSAPETLAVTSNAVAEAPALTVQGVSGNEGTSIPLPITVAQVESDLSTANLTINVSGLQGASLNRGTLNPDGSYTLHASDLQGLSVTPGAEFTGTLPLTVTATDSEPSSGTTATSAAQTLAVAVNPVAEAPTLSVRGASGDEGTSIPLSIAAAQAESDLSTANLTIKVSGLQGASLNHGTLNPDGSYTLHASDLQGLSVTPGAEFNGTLPLTVTATDSEPSSGTTATSAAQTLAVAVNPVAEAPTLAVQRASGDEGTSIPLSIAAAQAESDLSNANLTIKVSGLQGASLNHGMLNPDGSYTLHASDLQGLSVTPGAEFNGTLPLTVTATDSEPSSGTTATSAAQTLAVTVNPVAETPTLTVQGASGSEGTSIPLAITAAQAESDLSAANLTINVSGLQGASMNHGTLNPDGSYTLHPADLQGLSVSPSAEFTGSLPLTVTATDSEPSSATTATTPPHTLAVSVTASSSSIDPLAQTPTLSVHGVSGNEGSSIPLTIAAAQSASDLAVADLTVNVSGLQGASLNHGTLNSDGSYTLHTSDLQGLSVTPTAEFTGTLPLTVTATDSEPSSGTMATTIAQTLAVTVNPVAEAPTLTVHSASGAAGTAIPLCVAAAQTETDLSNADLTINVSGLQGDLEARHAEYGRLLHVAHRGSGGAEPDHGGLKAHRCL